MTWCDEQTQNVRKPAGNHMPTNHPGLTIHKHTIIIAPISGIRASNASDVVWSVREALLHHVTGEAYE
jgi:hypothetical protein